VLFVTRDKERGLIIRRDGDQFCFDALLGSGRAAQRYSILSLPISIFQAVIFPLKQVVQLGDVIEKLVAVFFDLDEIAEPMHFGGFFRGHGYNQDTNYDP
jgi:hypothetical protein